MLFVPDPSVERVRPPLSPRGHRIAWAGLASTLLHGSLLAGALVLWLRQPRVPVLQPVSQPATVQLVMSPPGSDHDSPVTTPSAKGPTAKPASPAPPKPRTPAKTVQQKPAKQPPSTAASAPPPPTPAPARVASDTPRPEPPKPTAPAPPQPTAPAAAPQPAPHAFALNLGAVESDTNALVTGNIVVPPSQDIKYHNRKPNYPPEAALRGEHGTVLLLAHVEPDGLVATVEVAQSSGYRMLDDAARDTVQTWHFLPSVKNGQPIAADVPVRIIYALDR